MLMLIKWFAASEPMNKETLNLTRCVWLILRLVRSTSPLIFVMTYSINTSKSLIKKSSAYRMMNFYSLWYKILQRYTYVINVFVWLCNYLPKFSESTSHTVPHCFGRTGLTRASSDQDWTSLPAAHHGRHLDLISWALTQVANGECGESSRNHMGLLIAP